MVPCRVCHRAITRTPTGLCATCQGLRRSDGTDRPTRTEAGYGNRWLRARARYLRTEPLCRYHREAGMVVEASQLDHLIPHRGDPELFWDRRNWQPVCSGCHSQKTAQERRIRARVLAEGDPRITYREILEWRPECTTPR